MQPSGLTSWPDDEEEGSWLLEQEAGSCAAEAPPDGGQQHDNGLEEAKGGPGPRDPSGAEAAGAPPSDTRQEYGPKGAG